MPHAHEGTILELLSKSAGPFSSIHATEKPECDPPIITTFFTRLSLIFFTTFLNYCRYSTKSDRKIKCYLSFQAGNHVKNSLWSSCFPPCEMTMAFDLNCTYDSDTVVTLKSSPLGSISILTNFQRAYVRISPVGNSCTCVTL